MNIQGLLDSKNYSETPIIVWREDFKLDCKIHQPEFHRIEVQALGVQNIFCMNPRFTGIASIS